MLTKIIYFILKRYRGIDIREISDNQCAIHKGNKVLAILSSSNDYKYCRITECNIENVQDFTDLKEIMDRLTYTSLGQAKEYIQKAIPISFDEVLRGNFKEYDEIISECEDYNFTNMAGKILTQNDDSYLLDETFNEIIYNGVVSSFYDCYVMETTVVEYRGTYYGIDYNITEEEKDYETGIYKGVFETEIRNIFRNTNDE